MSILKRSKSTIAGIKGTNYTVANIAERNALQKLVIEDRVLVLNDGDGKWAIYSPSGFNTDNTPSGWVKINDQDALENAITPAGLKSAYESNPDTNAFTDALLTKLTDISSATTSKEGLVKLGTSSSAAKPGDWLPSWGDVTGKPAVIAAGATQAAARTAIGAGTSNLALGTTSSTAAAGDHTHSASEIPNLDASKITTGIFSTARIPTLNQNTTGNAATATKLATARTVSVSGDATGTSAAFDGGSNITIPLTLTNSGVGAGTYGTNKTIPSFTVDAKGRVTGVNVLSIPTATTSATGIVQLNNTVTSTATNQAATPAAVKQAYDLANAAIPKSAIGASNGVAPLDQNGQISAEYLPSFVDDVIEVDSYADLPTVGETGKIYVTIDAGKIYRWSGSGYIWINSSVGTADEATRLTSSRTISATGDASWSVSFRGDTDASGTITLSSTGVTAGSYGDNVTIPTVTVDAKGRVTNVTATAIRAGTTSVTGLVRLNNTLTSTSTSLALTAAQGKVLQDSKVDKEAGKGLSSNDFTTELLNKLNSIQAGTGALATMTLPGGNAFLRGDGEWVIPTNTTYSTMSVAEGTAGTATSARTMRADYLKQIVNNHIDSAKVANNTDTTQGRIITTGYLDLGVTDKQWWPKTTSVLELLNGPDRTVWVEQGTLDAPTPDFLGFIKVERGPNVGVGYGLLRATGMFSNEEYIYGKTPLGSSGWRKDLIYEIGEWVDLRPYLLSPYFFSSHRIDGNYPPAVRLMPDGEVQMRGVVDFNPTSGTPPVGAAFQVPEPFRPLRTSGGVCFSDSEPMWFGTALWLACGENNYSGLSDYAHGNILILNINTPDPVQIGSVEISGIRYFKY